MATCTRQVLSATAERKGQDSESWVYLLQLDSIPNAALDAIDIAHSTGPHPVPVVGTEHPSRFIFVQTIQAEQTSQRMDCHKITVNFGPLEKGENEDSQNENPILRPAIYDIQHREEEFVVERAYNLETLGGSFGLGAPTRAAGTLGPITNSASIRPDEPIVRPRRKAILTILKNFATFGEILGINDTFEGTCNSDTVVIKGKSYEPRRLRFEVATSQGRQFENDYEFYPALIEISIHKTTDLYFDNVGYHYYTFDGDKKRFVDSDGNETAEPQNLTISGTKGDSELPIQLGYRYLEEQVYASLAYS